jgi:hypothetical protein
MLLDFQASWLEVVLHVPSVNNARNRPYLGTHLTCSWRGVEATLMRSDAALTRIDAALTRHRRALTWQQRATDAELLRQVQLHVYIPSKRTVSSALQIPKVNNLSTYSLAIEKPKSIY